MAWKTVMARRAYMKRWRSELNPEAYKRIQLNRRKNSPRDLLTRALRAALKRKPTTNSITRDELMQMYADQKGLCALSGMRMTWMGGGVSGSPTSISLDRINHKKGYTKKNVRLLCNAINCFRGRMNDKEMLIMAKILVRRVKP